jgi:hypothetical protein
VEPVSGRAGALARFDDCFDLAVIGLVRTWGLSALDYCERQERVALTINHGRKVGELLYLERDRHDRLVAVARADSNLLGACAWYFSPGVRHRSDGTEIRLCELALTRRPASVSLPPVTVLEGDLAQLTRQRFGIDPSRRKLLERAAGSVRLDGPLYIREHDEQPLAPGEILHGVGGPPGRMRRGAPGAILRVS